MTPFEETDLGVYATQEYVDEGLATKQPIGDYALKSDIPDASSAIIDVIELPTENIKEDVYYRKLTVSPVINQTINNAYTCHCVESLPETGFPAINSDQTGGNIYYIVGDGEPYGYVNDMLSTEFNVPAGWYPGATLLGALGYGYSGTITNIMDDPKDGNFRLLLEYVIYSYKDSWTSHKIIGWAGTGAASEIFNHPGNIASGKYSHAEGYSTTASGYHSHAEGSSTTASGYGSHAEGYSVNSAFDYITEESTDEEIIAAWNENGFTLASGQASHVEGYSTLASGGSSHAEGYMAIASGDYSHAEGSNTTASGIYQHVQGKYNVEDTNNQYAHIIGNGSSNSARSNAHTLDWNGNAWYEGDVYVGSTSGSNKDGGSKKLATESYVNESLATKQDKITGTAGDFVVIGEDGNVTTKTIPYAEEAEF